MKRTTRPASRRRAAVLAACLAISTLGLSGCAVLSPAVTATPYDAADGVNGEITGTESGTLKLRNFLVVGTAKGAPATLLGAITNDGNKPVEVKLDILPQGGGEPVASGTITAKPGQITLLGPQGEQVPISALPAAPGVVLRLSASTAAAGGTTINLPVLNQVGDYASLTPAPGAAG